MANTESDVEDLPADVEKEDEIVEEESSIYLWEDFISGPSVSENCTVPGNILEFKYSYGYDCKRLSNWVVADKRTLIFASGNYINFFDSNTQQFVFRRSVFGGGIGHITKNPNPQFRHIVVGKNGERPPIIVYECAC